MIAQALARAEKELESLLDDIAVDAFYHRGTGQIETVFISTEHDPSVGIFGGPVFAYWWDFVEWKEEGHPTDVRVVKEDWSLVQERKRWGTPEEWAEVAEVAQSPEARRIVYRALMDILMRPF